MATEKDAAAEQDMYSYDSFGNSGKKQKQTFYGGVLVHIKNY